MYDQLSFPLYNMVFNASSVAAYGTQVSIWNVVQSGAFKLVREGFVLLQFAPAAGVRQYDWSRKQVI